MDRVWESESIVRWGFDTEQWWIPTRVPRRGRRGGPDLRPTGETEHVSACARFARVERVGERPCRPLGWNVTTRHRTPYTVSSQNKAVLRPGPPHSWGVPVLLKKRTRKTWGTRDSRTVQSGLEKGFPAILVVARTAGSSERARRGECEILHSLCLILMIFIYILSNF